MFSIGAVLN
jgi:putative redox protein